MDANLIDRLTAQYVWAIQSDGDWYHKAQQAQKANVFGHFRRVTGNFIGKIEIAQRERLKGIEWAFVVLELWKQMGGSEFATLSDPGTLEREYLSLIHDDHEAPKQEFVRRKGDVFSTYGNAYTIRNGMPARSGMVYTESELTCIESGYHKGTPLIEISHQLARTGIGICEKMCLMGLLKRDGDGDYICAKDVPVTGRENTTSNPCGEIQVQIATHLETAAQHFGNVANQLETIIKEKSMSAIQTNPNTAIETKVIVFGQDAETLTEQQLIDAIKRIEGDIAKFKEVKTKSKKIAANIADLETSLVKIVEILDAR